MELGTVDLSDILVAVLGILATGLGFIIKEQREKIKKIQEQLSDRKYTLYHEIISVFFDLMSVQKKLKSEKEVNAIIRLLEVKKDMIFYAPDNVLRKFLDWNKSLSDPQTFAQFDNFLDLFVLIRKDMGHQKTIVTKDDILRLIMASDEDFLEIKNRIAK